MDQVEEVKSKVDIVEVISSYVPLKKMGRNFGGLCPFHGEKTPSFMVSPDRQSFKCFGCSEGGDVITFLQKIEGWEFREALEELAKRAGVKLKDHVPSKGAKVREKLVDIHKLAEKFYGHILNEHKLGEVAREYLKNRGVEDELWKKFDLGYSPDGWENTYNFLKKKGFDNSDTALSGLVVGREGTRGGFYDRFRARIMFPIKDNRGTTLGFSGRVLLKDVKEAKYVNSPETPIFFKGSLLFGLNVAKEAIREKNEVVLVEGEFDVISAHKAGVTNTVASKGTALTDKQVALIARLCENVVLCFDMDLAGDAAARRGIELLDIAGLNIKVVKFVGVKDPDEYAQKDPKGFKDAIAKAANVYDYLIDSAISRFDPKSPEGKKKIGKEILPIISKISDDLVRAHYITRIAKELGLEVNLIDEAVTKKDTSVALDTISEQVVSTSDMNIMDEYFMALFLAGDGIFKNVVDKLEPEDFQSKEISKLWTCIRDIISGSNPKTIAQLTDKVPEDFSKLIDHFYFINISPAVLEKEIWASEIMEVAARIKKRSYTRQLNEISASLKETKDSDKVAEITKRFKELSELLTKENTKL